MAKLVQTYCFQDCSTLFIHNRKLSDEAVSPKGGPMPSTVLIFKKCTCGHYQEDHGLPWVGTGCNVEGCECEQFEETK